MKISELANVSGESIPTIKFYIRKGLLPAGERSSSNQASYDESHLERIRLIGSLKAGLGMSLERIGEVFRSAQAGGEALLRAGLDAGQSLKSKRAASVETAPPTRAASDALRAMCGDLGWHYLPEDPAAVAAVEAVALVQKIMPEQEPRGYLRGYAAAMKLIADQEIPDDFNPAHNPMATMSYAVLGTYLFEPVILALRRMAHTQRVLEVRSKTSFESK